MPRLQGLDIDFPEIDGASERQVWYASHLRNAYILDHFERFEKISDTVKESIDKRILAGHDGYDPDYADESYSLKFNNAEMAVLYSDDAGGIISALKDEVYAEKD